MLFKVEKMTAMMSRARWPRRSVHDVTLRFKTVEYMDRGYDIQLSGDQRLHLVYLDMGGPQGKTQEIEIFCSCKDRIAVETAVDDAIKSRHRGVCLCNKHVTMVDETPWLIDVYNMR